ncbi:MAG: nicotinate (nicotinamide) nucleotide adenylyltransferase [Acidobacteriaceae bacterium]
MLRTDDADPMKTGWFGGSFDPPHRGHLALAQLAQQRLGLDRVLFAPVGVQPLKRDRAHDPESMAGFQDRVAMTRLAIAGQPGFEVSLMDAPRDDDRPNYTVDTLRTLRAQLPSDDSLYCLMGADSFLSIGKWYRAADLLLSCDFAVAARPGFDLGRLTAALPPSISVGACNGSGPANLVLCLRDHTGRESRLWLLPDLADDVSASAIRAALEKGSDAGPAIDPGVAAYIRDHWLYRPNDGNDAPS